MVIISGENTPSHSISSMLRLGFFKYREAKLITNQPRRSRASAPSSISLLSTPTTKYNPLSDRNTISLQMPKHRIESLSPGPIPAQRKRPQFESLRSPPLPPNNKSATAPTVAGLAFRISCIPSRITKEQFLQILHTLPNN